MNDFPLPRFTGGEVLYLDWDGVLHPEQVYLSRGGKPYVRQPAGRQLFENAELLIRLLRPYPGVRLVLSTSWVHHYGFKRAAAFLPEMLRSRCIGATYHREMRREMGIHWFQQLARGQQVRADVVRRKPCAWLALDDDVEGWGEARDTHLVATHPVDGIAAPAVLERLTEAIKRFATADNRECQ